MVTIIDYSGDSVMTEAPIGPGPTAFTLDELGATGYTINSDGTLSNFAITTSLQAKNVCYSTLPPTAQLVNLMPPSSGLWATDLNAAGRCRSLFRIARGLQTRHSRDRHGEQSRHIAHVHRRIPNHFRRARIRDQPERCPIHRAGMTCNHPPRTASHTGVATPIEISSNTADPAIPVGKCPVYAVQTPDQQRFFVLNRGDDTITVINTRNNTLDQCRCRCRRRLPGAYNTNQNGQTITYHPVLPLSTTALTATDVTPPNCNIATNPTCGMGAIAGPVYAEYNAGNAATGGGQLRWRIDQRDRREPG